jgi:hypothetical protein
MRAGASAGQLLNPVKQGLEEAPEARRVRFDEDARNARLQAEWLDLTLPAPEPARSFSSDQRIQAEIEAYELL